MVYVVTHGNYLLQQNEQHPHLLSLIILFYIYPVLENGLYILDHRYYLNKQINGNTIIRRIQKYLGKYNSLYKHLINIEINSFILSEIILQICGLSYQEPAELVDTSYRSLSCRYQTAFFTIHQLIASMWFH